MKTNKMHTFHTDVLIYRENPSTGYTAYINAWKYTTKKTARTNGLPAEHMMFETRRRH